MPSNHARDAAHHLGEASNALERLTTESAALQAEVERLKGEYDLACGLLNTSLENEKRLIEESKQATPPACEGEHWIHGEVAKLAEPAVPDAQPEFFLPEGCTPTLPPKITPLGSSAGSATYVVVDAQPRAAPDSQVSISEKLSASEPAESSFQDVCETAANISLLVSELQARLMTATQPAEKSWGDSEYCPTCEKPWDSIPNFCSSTFHQAAPEVWRKFNEMQQRAEQAERERDEAKRLREFADMKYVEACGLLESCLPQNGVYLHPKLYDDIHSFLFGEHRATDEVPVPVEPRSGSAAETVHGGPEVPGVQQAGEQP